MTEPRTEAGKRLLDTDRDDYSLKLAYLTDAVLAIEAEATAAAEQRLRERIEGLHGAPFGEHRVEANLGWGAALDDVRALLDSPEKPT